MNKTELREKSLSTAHEARALLDTVKSDNSNSAEVESKFADMMKESDSLAQRAENIERYEAREREMNKIDNVSDAKIESRGNQSEDEKRDAALTQYLRGEKNLGEIRAMGVATDPKGGALVSTGFINRMITKLRSEGPMLDPTFINMLVTEKGNPIEMPSFDDDKRAVIIGENTQIPEDDLEFGSKTLGAFKYTSKLVRVSNELLQDAEVDAQDIVSGALSKRIGRGLNDDLTNGTGVGMPEGLMTAATQIASAGAAVSYEDLFALQHSIDSAYRDAAAWMFSDAFLLKARTMKDGQGNLAWNPGFTLDAPATILGRPYRINPFMNSDFTTGKAVAAFGDFKAYTVRQVKGIYVRRLDERYADWDQVGFVGLARYDGKLLDTSAIKVLKTK